MPREMRIRKTDGSWGIPGVDLRGLESACGCAGATLNGLDCAPCARRSQQGLQDLVAPPTAAVVREMKTAVKHACCSGRKDLVKAGLPGANVGLSDLDCAQCGSPRQPQFAGLEGLGDLGVYGKTVIEELKSNERSMVTVQLIMYGQPPLSVQVIIDRASKALLELGYTDIQIGAPKTYPLAWSWAWEAEPQVWTAYVSNPGAGPFQQELDIAGSPYYVAQDTAPTAAATKNYPTQGAILTIDATPPVQLLSKEGQGQLRDALRRHVKGVFGTDVRTYLKVWGKKKGTNWWLAACAVGGLAFVGKKLRDAR